MNATAAAVTSGSDALKVVISLTGQYRPANQVTYHYMSDRFAMRDLLCKTASYTGNA